jgi:hypothetical protein
MTNVISIVKSKLLSKTTDTEVYELPEQYAEKFDALSNARYVRMEAEKEEKRIKAEILATLPARTAGDKSKRVLSVAGVIRASVSVGSKDSVKVSDLRLAFPEAAEALVKVTTYDIVNPA